MTYKKCGFRDKVNVCSFKPEDCNPEECDFYNIDFSVKGIKKQTDKEKKLFIEIHEELKQMKKDKTHKEDKERYNHLKKQRKDKVLGILKLSKAFAYLKRSKKNE